MTLVNATTGIVHIGGEKYLDKYDFDMDGRPLRDFATWYGRPGGKMMENLSIFMAINKQKFQ